MNLNGGQIEPASNRIRILSESFFPYGKNPFLFGVLSIFDIWGTQPEHFEIPGETDARALIAKSWRIAGKYMYDAMETSEAETNHE